MSWEILYKRAYVPYSNNPKACVIEGKSGEYYLGVRIENVSFPLTISAIQAACFSCLSEGDTPSALFLPNSDFDQLEFWKNEFNLSIQITETPPTQQFKSQLHSDEFNELARLKELLKKAITTYSDFPVSAILYTESGYVEGVNIEVSDWSLGLCAERVAFAKAISNGETKFTEIAVHTKLGEVSSPCGACRQVIIEHLPLHKLRMHHSDETLSEHISIDLLPFSFTSKSLKK
ncbi:MAG: cytidine deaminase [Balneolaceae bacterium]